MRNIFIAILILLTTTLAYADRFEVLCDCFPKELQEIFKDNGFSLDLDANDRTPSSWGFLRIEGEWFSINTYYPTTDEEIAKLRKIIGEYQWLRQHSPRS